MKQLLRTSVLASCLGLGLLLSGCASSTSSGSASKPAPAAPPAKTETAARTGGACSACTCRKFEPRVEDSSVCRMCWHAAAGHTR